MNKTLQDFLESADEIHNEIIKSEYLNVRKTKNQLYELESYIKQIQTISHRMAKIYNTCKNKLENGFVIHRSVKLNNIDPFPKKDNWVNMINIPNNNSKSLVPGIDINIKNINEIDEIPNTPLYWIKSTNQFAFRINGVLLRGNIGNIFTNSNNISSLYHVEKCKHKNKCIFLLSGKKCKFYHDPLDLYNLYKSGKISEDILNIYKCIYKNFTSSSWIYTDDIPKRKNKMMRFVGNRNSLKNELSMSNLIEKNWSENFQSQVMHDFLVLMAINQKNLLSDYPKVKFVSEDYKGNNIKL